MENKDQISRFADGVNGAGSLMAPTDAMHDPPPGAVAGMSLDEPYASMPPISQRQHRSQATLFLQLTRRLDVVLVALLILGAVVAFFALRDPPELSSNSASEFDPLVLPLDDLVSGKSLAIGGASNVTINGNLQVNSDFSLAPSLQPTGAKAGQIYYDQGTNQLAYFNGEQFVFMTDGQHGVQSIGGITGELVLGAGLGASGQQLTNTGVLTVQGQTGDVSFAAGTGITLNGTTVTNDGVISILPGSPNITVSDDGNGSITIGLSGAGSGTVTSSGGAAGTIPLFTGSQNIENSIITQSGLAVTIAGSLNLGNALTVGNGGTGTNTLTANGILLGNGAAAVSSLVAAGANLCLLSTVGAPVWAACPAAGGGVTSLNGLAGALNVANASAAGNTVTLDDASNLNKGIASFNSTNFSVTSGAVNTVQDIHSSATPTFTGVNTNTITPSAALTVGIGAQTALLQGSTTTITSNGVGNNIILNSDGTIELQDSTNVAGDLAVNGGDITSTGALNITPGGTATVGVATQTLTLQGGASTSFRATDSGSTTVVGFASPTANTTLNFPALAAGTYTVCTTGGNCAGVATTLQSAYDNSTSPEIVLDASLGALTIRDDATPLGANLLEVQNNDGTITYLAVTGSGIAVTGTATVSSNVNASSGSLQTAGTTRIDNGGNATNIGSLSLSGAISGGTTYTGSGNINTTAGGIQTNSSTRIDNSGNLVNIVDVTASGDALFQGGGMVLGSNAQAGSLTVYDGSSNTGTLQVAALGQNTTYILPDPGTGSVTICLSTGNCSGVGGGVTTPGGSTNRLAKFTGSQTISDSIITDNGATVTVAGAFETSGNATIQGGSLTIGTAAQAGSLILSDGSSHSGMLQIAALAQDTTYTLPDPGGVAAGICLTTGNCSGVAGGVTTAGGTAGRITVFTGSQAIGNSWFLQNSSTLELDATRNLSLLGGNLSVTGGGTFSGDIALNGGDLTSTGALNITPSGTLTIGAASQQLILQGNASTQLTATDSGNTTAIVFQTPTADVTYTLPTATTGNYDLCTTAGNCSGVGGGVTTSGGTTNRLAKFSGAQSVDDSTISDDGTNVTTSVDMIIQGGSLTLGTASQLATLVLHDGNGQTTTLQSGDASGNLTFILPVNSGSANQCLKQSGAGNQLVWQDCDGGAGGTSATLQTAYDNSTDPEFMLNSSVGGLSIRDNATPISGNLFEVQNSAGGTDYFSVDATGAAVTGLLAATGNINTSGGAVQTAGTTRIDNGGNLVNIGTVTAGTYNGQTISSAANFTGTVAVAGNTTLTGDLAVNGGDITSTGALNITPGGVLTVGATNQQLILQGNANTQLTATGGGFTTTVGFTGTPTGAVTYNFDRAAAAGTYSICTSIGNCAGSGGGVTTAGGSTGTIAVFTGTQAIGNSLLSQSGGTVTVNGNLNLVSGNQFQVNGTQISSSALSNDANLAKLSASQTFTGNTVAFQNAANSTNAFNVQTLGGARILTADTTGAQIVLGVGSSLDGRLVFSNATNANTVTVSSAAVTGSRTVTFPDASGAICLTSGNCLGISGDVTTAGGTANRLPLFSGTQAIANSWLFQNVSTLELDSGRGLSLLGGSLSVTGNGTFTGDVSVNGGDLTSSGAITISSSGAGNDVIVNGNDQFIVQDIAQFNAQTNFDLGGNGEVYITGLGAAANTRDYLIISMNNGSTSGIQNGILVENLANTGATEAFATFNNVDTDTAVGYGIQMTSAAGGITTALDVSDADIGVALAFGANDLDGANFDVNGTTGEVTTRTATNSNNAFRVLNSSNVPIFVADTSADRFYVGDPAADATGALLVLDTKTSTLDPTGVDGGMYYSSYREAFRCYEGNAWKECLGVPKPNSRRTTYMVANGTSTWSGSGDVFTETGTVSSTVGSASAPPSVDYLTGASNGDAAGIAGNLNYGFGANSRFLFQANVRLDSSTPTSRRFWSGLTNQSQATMAASATPAGHYAAFRVDTGAGDTNIQCVTNNNTTPTVVDSGISALPGSDRRYEISVVAGNHALFKIDGQVVCGANGISTTLPGTSVAYRTVTSLTTLTTATRQMFIGWVYVESTFASF